MPGQTTNLQLPIPLGNEYNKRAALVNLIEEIDIKVAGKQVITDVSNDLATHLVERASKTDFGHMKVGTGLSVLNGVVSADVLEIATADEAKGGVVNNKAMTPLRTKEAFAELAPKPIIASPGTNLITDNVTIPGASLPVGATSADIVRWVATLEGVVRVVWKATTNTTSSTSFLYTWVEVDGVRQGDEKTVNLNQVATTTFSQEVSIQPDNIIAIRYRHSYTNPLVLGLAESYIGAILNKFAREV